jgi:hypothetical protein
MSIDDRFSASDYIPALYVDVTSILEEFQKTGEVERLRTAAEILCDGVGRLCDDGVFWAAINDLPGLIEKDQKQVDQLLGDVDELLRQEEIILTKVLGQQKALRLIGDLNLAIGLLREQKGGLAAENLRRRVSDLKEAVCRSIELLTPSPAEPDGGKWRRGVLKAYRLSSKALFVVGGSTVIVLNWKATVATFGVSAASTLSGLKMIQDQFPKD